MRVPYMETVMKFYAGVWKLGANVDFLDRV
jgi:hypothetical protein